MANGKYANGKRLNVKPIVALLAIVMLVGAAVGGTLAWLTDETKAIENTFTVGNIHINLTETPNADTDNDKVADIWQGKMVPGCTLDKDPVVTVVKGSEDCWVFIKAEEKCTRQNEDVEYKLTDFISYTIDENNWTKLTGEDNIWYTKYTNRDDVDIGIKILENNQVAVKETVTKQMMDDLTSNNVSPKLTFTAYAIQMAGFDKVEDAWNSLQDSLNP